MNFWTTNFLPSVAISLTMAVGLVYDISPLVGTATVSALCYAAFHKVLPTT